MTMDDGTPNKQDIRAGLGHVTDTIFRRMLRNAGTLLGGKLAMGLLNLAATGIALRAMGVDSYGLLILIHSLTQAIASFTKFQSWQAIIRYGSANLENGRRPEFRALVRFTAWLDIASGAFGILLCAGLALFTSGLFGIPAAHDTTTALYASSMAFMVMATPTGLLRLFNRFDLLATRDTFGALFRLAGAALGMLLGWDLPGFLTVWYLATAFGGLSLAFAAWREMKRQGLLDGDEPPVAAVKAHPGIWSFVWSTNMTTTLALASGNMGTLCVGALLGPAEAAIFSLARQIGEAALKPGRFLSPAIYPELGKLAAAGNVAGTRALLRKVLVISSIGSAILLAALTILGKPLLRLIGGEQAIPAYPIMLMLGVAAAIGFAAFALEPLLISTGRQRAALRARMLAAILYIPVAWLGIQALGLAGVGLASILMAFVVLLAQARPALDAILAPRAEKLGKSAGPP